MNLLENKTYGIMVTASHNPYTDNGIKIFDNGNKLNAEDEQIIESIIDDISIVNNTKQVGEEKSFKDIMDKYLKLYDGLLNKVDLKIALDLANGAATSTAETVFSHLTDDFIIISNEPDGLNINHNCGSTHLERLQNVVSTEACDLGIAFDGDADRLMVVDHQGEVCDGDFLIYLFASYLKANKQLKNKFVALSKMCNIGIIKALNEKDIDVIQTDVGDKYITKAIEDNDGVLGGENSGHIINKLLFETGDGVLNAAFLIKILDYYKVPLAVLKEQVQYYPDKLINLKNIDKSLAKHPKVLEKVIKYQEKLGEDGKILVRASGTEPLIRISASAPTEHEVDTIIEDIKSTIESLVKEGK